MRDILCRWFGHKWVAEEYVKMARVSMNSPLGRYERVCQRCGQIQQRARYTETWIDAGKRSRP